MITLSFPCKWLATYMRKYPFVHILFLKNDPGIRGWLMYALPLTVGKSEMFFYNRCFQEPFSLNIHSADVNYWCCKKLHLITVHSTELSHVENEPSKMRLRTQINVNWNQLLRITQTANKKLTTEMLSSLFVFSTLI